MPLPTDTGYTKLSPSGVKQTRASSQTQTLGRTTAPPPADSRNVKADDYERIKFRKGGKNKHSDKSKTETDKSKTDTAKSAKPRDTRTATETRPRPATLSDVRNTRKREPTSATETRTRKTTLGYSGTRTAPTVTRTAPTRGGDRKPQNRRKMAQLLQRIFASQEQGPELFPRIFAVFLVWFLIFGFVFGYMWLNSNWLNPLKAALNLSPSAESDWCYIQTNFTKPSNCT